MPTVAELLRASGLPPLEARALLAKVTGTTREALVAHPEHSLDIDVMSEFDRLALRRRSGEPLAYLTGEREFYGRRFAVNRSVLIPRPETELLVRLVLERVARMEHPRILDLGTGSACIAATLALEAPRATVYASDLSASALEVARANAAALGARVTFIESDWFAAIDGHFDIIVSNPPYVAQGDPHLHDLGFEPQSALVAGNDGLECVRPVLANAPAHLVAGGWLLLEHGYNQAARVRELLVQAGFQSIRTSADDAGNDRVSCGTLLR